MTLDQLQARDRRIAELEAIPRGQRGAARQDELCRLLNARDLHWRRLGRTVAQARRKARELEQHARQIGMVLNG